MPIGNGCYRVRFADGRLQEVHGAAEAVAVILDGLPDDGALRPQTQSGFETAAGHRASGSAPRLARPAGQLVLSLRSHRGRRRPHLACLCGRLRGTAHQL
jgi:hypothetical protein